MENKQAISEQMKIISEAFSRIAEMLTVEHVAAEPADTEDKVKKTKPKAEVVKEELPEAPEIEQDGKPSYEELKALTLKVSRAGHSKAIRDKLSDLGVQRIGQLESEEGIMEFWGWLNEQDA